MHIEEAQVSSDKRYMQQPKHMLWVYGEGVTPSLGSMFRSRAVSQQEQNSHLCANISLEVEGHGTSPHACHFHRHR